MTALESTFFHVERHGAVVHLVMNRPDRANAMSSDFWTDLPRLIAHLGRDETVRCAVISGAQSSAPKRLTTSSRLVAT